MRSFGRRTGKGRRARGIGIRSLLSEKSCLIRVTLYGFLFSLARITASVPRQQNVNIKWHLTNFMSGCVYYYLLVLQLKKLSRELYPDDIITLSEGVSP